MGRHPAPRVLCLALTLTACATAPRGPAGRLADAGTTAATTLATDVDALSLSLDRGEAGEAFERTWQTCANSRLACTPQLVPDANAKRRHQLADAVRSRARALHALAGAYAALKEEADYEGRADLKGATLAAAGAVDAYVSLVAKAAPQAAIADAALKPLTGIAGEIGGTIGGARQRRRIIAASRAIGAATARLQLALKGEAGVFDSIAGYIVLQQTAARLALLDAGMVSSSDLLAPMAQDLDVKLAAGADAAVARSPGALAAVKASVQALSAADVAAVQARYRDGIAALGALAAAHADLEANRPVSVEDVAQTLAALDAALAPKTPKEDAK